MISPKKALAILKKKNVIAARHPEFVGFVGQTLRDGLKAGDKLYIVVVHEDGTKERSGIRVTPEDQEVFQDIGSAFKGSDRSE